MREIGAVPHAVADAPREARDRELSSFEFWPSPLFYFPIVLQWVALGLRYGNPLLPTCANPLIEAGGLCGESKSSILDQLGPESRHWVAPYGVFELTGEPTADLAAAEETMERAGLAYPVVLKPDVGCNGAGVKLVPGRDVLLAYLGQFPARERLMLQELVPHEGEAGIFYVRRPGAETGRITSLTLKSTPYVVGDGRSTLEALVLADKRAGRIPQIYLPRLGARLGEVPAAGERVRLVFVGNHCRGSIFRDGRSEITAAMSERFDAIARTIPEFHFGRFDVRFRSIEELKRGEGFRIIEVNGAGSEATHIWDRDTTLRAAYAAQFEHYRLAFEIGAANRRRGYKPTSPFTLLRMWRRQRRLIASYPISD